MPLRRGLFSEGKTPAKDSSTNADPTKLAHLREEP
jgi:hypothetical protein